MLSLFLAFSQAADSVSNSTATNDEQSIASNANYVWIIIIMFLMFNFYFKNGSISMIFTGLLSTFSAFIIRYLIYAVGFKKGHTGISFSDATLCALSCLLSLGCFNGIIKFLHYFLYGILFAATYTLVHWLIIDGDVIKNVVDTGHSIEVHLLAASFGIGAAMAVREKRIVGRTIETLPYNFNWLVFATLIIAFLWPVYATIYLSGHAAARAYTTVVMSVFGSTIVSAFIEHFYYKKINLFRLINSVYVGCIGVGCSILIVGPWGGLLIGAICGLTNTFLMPLVNVFIQHKLGIEDLLSVFAVHGVSSWIAIFCGLISSYIKKEKGVWILVGGLIALGIGLVAGAVTGALILLTKCGEIENADFMNDEAFFDITLFEKNEESKPVSEL